ncbi:MAG: DNA/RNA non-specific endonuclease [Ruminococcus sp.]|nr:DNA/RNA non-specific endonuclease [Ruminococcus sp.]
MKRVILAALAAGFMLAGGACALPFADGTEPAGSEGTVTVISAEEPAPADDESRGEYVFSMPEYTGEDVITLNGGMPCFTDGDAAAPEGVVFSGLDSLGRCGAAFARIGRQLLPREEREPIGTVKPAGWQTVKYRNVDGKYLYNRCHLIAFELCGVNADERNLITGTRWLNVEGMLSSENLIRSFVEEKGGSVLYRVTPRYSGEELLARGVEIEALSDGDGGQGVCLHLFCFNVQPGIVIDYLTGESYPLDPENEWTEEGSSAADDSHEPYTPPEGVTYIVNAGSHRFHLPECKGVQDMKPSNRREFYGSREELIELGFSPCGSCKP